MTKCTKRASWANKEILALWQFFSVISKNGNSKKQVNNPNRGQTRLGRRSSLISKYHSRELNYSQTGNFGELIAQTQGTSKAL